MVPHTVPARGGLVPHTDRLHMGQGARSTGLATQGSSSSYGSTSRRSCGDQTSLRYGLYGSYGSGKSGGKSAASPRDVSAENKPVDLTNHPQSPAGSHNDLNIADVHVGDKLMHDHFGVGYGH